MNPILENKKKWTSQGEVGKFLVEDTSWVKAQREIIVWIMQESQQFSVPIGECVKPEIMKIKS